MAYVFAHRAFDMLGSDFNLRLMLALGEVGAKLDRSFTVGEITYQDRIVVTPNYGTTHLTLASKGFSLDPNIDWVEGDISGLFVGSGPGAAEVWAGLQGLSISVFEFDWAMSTYRERELIEEELAGADRFELSGENDRAYGYRGNDVMMGRAGADTLVAGGGNDRVEGGKGDDLLIGEMGDDVLEGAQGHDVINGGSGRDRLAGGAGADRLQGGGDRDLFVFRSAGESRGTGRDTVADFVRGVDDIDLRAMDARATTAGLNDAFVWAGQTAGKFAVWWSAEAAGGVILKGDLTGDSVSDFSIRILGTTSSGAALTALDSGNVLL